MKQLTLSSYFLLFTQLLFAQNVKLTVEGALQLKKDAAANLILQSDASGLGTWVKPINQQRKVIDVLDFGAIADQATDNTAAFQSAIDSAATFGGTVFIPAGNYVFKGELTIPGGVVLEGESQGGDYLDFFNPARGSCLIYEGLDFFIEMNGFFSGIKNIHFYNSGFPGNKAAGCIRIVAKDGQFSTGYTVLANLYINYFFEGTCIKLEATNNSQIAHIMVEDVTMRIPKTGMHVAAQTGSTINHISIINGKIGGGLQYSFRNQGGTNINVYGTTFEGVACGSQGHLVVESGNINIYGFRTESTDSEGSCDESKIILVHFFPYTTGSYIQGFLGEGMVIDEGDNHLDVSGKNIINRSSGYNVFQNSSFQGVQNNNIPQWTIIGNLTSIKDLPPVFLKNSRVLTLTIPAGEIVRLTPNAAYLPSAHHHQLGAFGAYLKTNLPYTVFARMEAFHPTTNTCTIANSSFHPGDDQWHFISLPATLNESICGINPEFVFDNSGRAQSAKITITTPSFVFGNTRPVLAVNPLLSAGGQFNGTLSEGLCTFPILVNEVSELTLPFDGNTFLLTGTNTIQRLNNNTLLGKRFPKGTIVQLLFDSAGVTVKNGAYINLIGTVDYVSTVGSSLTLVAIESGTWREIGRNL